MPQGIDSPVDCTQAAHSIALNYAFVGRYYRKSTSKWDALSASELAALNAAGLKVVALWEANSTDISYFSSASGVDDGSSAYKQALMSGQPPNTPIYFAVDFDASMLAVTGSISDYFKGVANGFNAIAGGSPAYTLGVYGSGQTCAFLLAHGLSSYTWLSMSTGWSRYADFTSWNIKQGPSDGSLSIINDTDEAVSDFGGF